MSDFYNEIYQLSAKTTPQVAVDLGILSGFLCSDNNPNYDSTKKAASAALLRLAKLLATDGLDEDHVDLDDAMDQEEEAAAANGQIL